VFVFLIGALAVFGDPKHPVSPAQIVAEQAYDIAKSRYETNQADAIVAWQFARACFEVADLSDKDSERAKLGHAGADVCEQLLKRDPNNAAAHYYLGMNIGQVAQTKSLGALPLVRQMRKEWEMARGLDEHLDFAGPDRNLGMLYRDAPNPPLSVGSRAQALQHMARAVELAPDYPENYLNLIESDFKWDRMDDASRQNEKLREILPAARKELTGPHWQGPWKDWEQRRADIDLKLSEWRQRHGQP
jgi:tetratricopeptide (TPR) repeat protein